MMRRLVVAGLAAIAVACSPAEVKLTPEQIAAESQKLTDYLNAEFEEELAMSPEALTRLGRRDQYDKLDDYSEDEVRAQLDWRRQSVADMKAQIDQAKLSEDARTSWDIWEMELAREEMRVQWLRHPYVFGFGGPHTDLPNFLITYHKVESPADLDAYVARLGELARALDQLTERAKLAAADGIRAPKFGYDRTAREARNMITGAPFGPGADSPLWADLDEKIGYLLASDRADDAQAVAWKSSAQAVLRCQW
jgi:uncharacterized protein (DUF885 family)